MDVEVLRTMEVYEQMHARGWLPYFDLRGPIRDEEVRIFYSNVFGENNRDNSFYSTIYGCPIIVNPDYIAKLLRIPREAEGIPFLAKLSPEREDEMTDVSLYPAYQLGHEAPPQVRKPLVKFYGRVFSY